MSSKTLLQKFLPSPVSSVLSTKFNPISIKHATSSSPIFTHTHTRRCTHTQMKPTSPPVTAPFLNTPLQYNFKSCLHSLSPLALLPFSQAHTNPSSATAFLKVPFTSSGHSSVLILSKLFFDTADLSSLEAFFTWLTGHGILDCLLSHLTDATHTPSLASGYLSGFSMPVCPKT